MDTNILLEIFGYIGTAFIILSMTMKSINKLRIFNLTGSIISVIYSVMIVAWPTVVLNVCLAAINIYHLTKNYRSKRYQEST